MISKCARGAALFVAAGLFVSSGCILGTTVDNDPKEPVADYRPLTDKENVIHNLVESYKWADIEEYTKLLHPDYVWVNQPEDVISRGLPEFYTREQDSAMTGNLFSAKLGTHDDPLAEIESLTLTISSGGWLDVLEMNGDPCEDCWETTRIYELIVTMPAKMLYANDLVRFIVVPVIENEQKLYKLIRAEDIRAN